MFGIIVVSNNRPPKRRRFHEGKYDGLLGNRVDRPSVVRSGSKKTTDRERVLLTARRDLLAIRESILAGRQEEALEKADWTLDQIENALSEKC